MKTTLRLLLACALLAAPGVLAQSAPQLVQRAPQHLDACSTINGTAAINTAVTITLTPPSGQYVYVCGIDLTSSNDATGTTPATNLSWTSTNLGSFTLKFSGLGTANTMQFQYASTFGAKILKSAQAGTAVTLVSPAGLGHDIYNVNVYYYYGP